jgi:predicted secreted hydrolase
MEHLIVIFSLILCFIIVFTGSGIGICVTNEKAITSIQDITLQDDAFHGRGKFPFIEWWYFDAKFENGYTMTLGVQVIDIILIKAVTTRLTIYNQGVVVMKSMEKHSLDELIASFQIPSVAIAGKQLILGKYDAINDCFIYNVTVEVSEGSLSLQFIGDTKGWKRKQQTGDWWVVVLPRATVTGTMTIGSSQMNVTGIGYHDHNWHVHPVIVLNFGWLWGTCYSSNYTITWAKLLRMRLIQCPILVVNGKDDGFLGIPPETIWFSIKNTQIDHLKSIPWCINIETMTEKAFLVLNMQVISVDYTMFLGFIDYWRYHIKCTGMIIKDSRMESIQGISIMEYLRFR